MLISLGAFAQNIITGEYFFDLDPGYNNGQAINFTPSDDISDQIESINITGLSNGAHRLFIRTQNDIGEWSNSTIHNFVIVNNPATTQLTEMEYYYDVDPGEGNGTNIPINSSIDILDFSTTINTAGISNGLHLLHIRSKNVLNQWSHSNSSLIFKRSNTSSPVSQIEYFIDSDPGLNNATPINFSPANDIIDLSSSISSNTITQGSHLLGIRSKDNLGQWSQTNFILLYKLSDNAPQNITELEYFIGNDPGQGNGQSINISASSNIVNLNTLISTNGLSSGTYTLNVRSKDDRNQWSHISSTLFFYTGSQPISNIAAIEYFFGLDPGKGNGTSVSITPNTDIVNLQATIQTSSIPSGANVLNIRSQDVHGQWSQTNQVLVLKQEDNLEDITKIEYYFDQDPGKGNASTINLSADINISDLSSLISTSTLSNGPHRLAIRAQQMDGTWSLDQHFLIIKQPEDIAYNINQAEYFIGQDPGLGNGQALNINPGNQIILIQSIDASLLGSEAEEIHVRTKDETDRWSHNYVFPVKKRGFTTHDISSGEYFFDNDPGLNNATGFTIPSDVDIQDLNLIVMANNLSDGLHDLYIRTVDTNNQWSLTNISLDILVDQALPLSWLDFYLEKQNDGIHLIWEVEEAINTSHFEIEKSQTNNFNLIGTVQSENSPENISYKFLDESPHKGWNYYRIKQVDQDGQFTYSEQRSVFISVKTEIKVYPNPTTQSIYISGLDSDKNYQYSLLNAQNQLIHQGSYSDAMLIDIADYPNGNYFLILKENNRIESFLIIKQ